MRIGACQTPDILGDVDAASQAVLDAAARADREDLDVLLFPECFLQGYLTTEQHVHHHAFTFASARFATLLDRFAGARQVLVLGVIEHQAGRYYNTAVVIRAGRIVGRYRKRFLTTGEETVFTPGEHYPTFDVAGLTFGINICYDTQFPDAAAAVAARGARVLLVPAQNMMRQQTARRWQHQHHALRTQRAQETGMWIVSADVTGTRSPDRIALGPTSVINPDGQVIAQVPTGTTGMVIANIDRP